MIKEIWDSVKDSLDNRMKTPFGGALLVGWLIVNWEPLLLLMFDSSTVLAKRINNFKHEIDFVNAFVIPFLVAIALLIIHQVCSYFSFRFTEWVNAKKSDYRITVKKQSIMSTKAAIKLLEEYNSQESKFLNAFEKHQKEIQEKNALIDAQKDTIQELNRDMSGLQEESLKQDKRITKQLEEIRLSNQNKVEANRKEFEKGFKKQEDELDKLRSKVTHYQTVLADIKSLVWSLNQTINNFSAVTILTKGSQYTKEKVNLFTDDLREIVSRMKNYTE